LDEAEKVLRDAIALAPESIEPKLALAEFLLNRRDKTLAEKELLAFIQQEPGSYPLKFGLANLYEALGQVDKARNIYQTVIEMAETEPQGLTARTKLALLLFRNRDFEEVSRLLEEVLEENPRAQEALALRGNLALAKKEPSQAIEDFRTALRDDPNSSKLLRLLARAHMINNEPELARDNLRRAVSENPQDVDARADFAELLAKNGENDAYSGPQKLDHRLR
jgi:Tfp pilus assembly protein PilF